MISVFLKEQKRYTQTELKEAFLCSDEMLMPILRKLKEYGIIKVVMKSETQRNLSELLDEDVVISDVSYRDLTHYYVVTFVGVIVIGNMVIKCLPKYMDESSPSIIADLKTILKVLKKVNASEQIIKLYNGSSEGTNFNTLAIILWILNDFYENGSYINTQNIIESNGNGEILWDRTINETFAYLTNNKPIYPELLTRKEISDDYDYIRRLHECVVCNISKDLCKSDLMDLFEMVPVEVSDETIEDFGDPEYILYRIEQALNVQFNDRKKLLLQALYAYINNEVGLYDIDSLSMFGTSSFNMVWEDVCQAVFNNKLQRTINELFPDVDNKSYDSEKKLIEIIEKPLWEINGNRYLASDTLIPDIITLYHQENKVTMAILDAKYYTPSFDPPDKANGYPGIESVSKQYLYQLAYQKFIKDYGIDSVVNAFLLPTIEKEIRVAGKTTFSILQNMGLHDIIVVLLPPAKIYEAFLKGDCIDLTEYGI